MRHAIGEAERLVAHASSVAMALADIGINLPPSATADAAQLRAVAELYFAAELDSAGLFASAEALAGLNGSSGLPFPLGSAATDVAHFWEGRHTRTSASERAALFARLFGTDTGVAAADHPGNEEFQIDMIELAEALYKLDEQADNPQWGGIAQQARVRRAASAVIDGLANASNSFTVMMAEDLLRTLKLAFAIFNHPDLRLALGARDMWGAISAALRLARLPATDPSMHATRAKAGMTILSWLAEAAPLLANPSGPLVALDHPVIAAAVDWLEVSLKIGEASAPPQTAPAQAPLAA